MFYVLLIRRPWTIGASERKKLL